MQNSSHRGEGMGTKKNHSVQKAFALLGSFRDAGEWVTNAELSRRAHLSTASAHRLMRTMEEIGAVVRNSRGRYRPGMVLATLSRNVVIGDLIRVTSQSAINDLARRLKAIVHVGVLENGMVNYVEKVGKPICVPIPSRVGAQQEPYCSALGKVLLAGLPEDELEEFLYDRKLIPLTTRTITSVDRLRSEIKSVRLRRYAVDDREGLPTVCCVGVPILDPNGQTIAALSVADTAAHMSSGWCTKTYHALRSSAEDISRKIYPSGEHESKLACHFMHGPIGQ